MKKKTTYSIRNWSEYNASLIRIVERLELLDGKWGIVLFQAIYQMDMIAAANPGQRLDLDEEKLASYRSSYRFLSYFLAHYGIKVRPDLPGIDRPESKVFEVLSVLPNQDA